MIQPRKRYVVARVCLDSEGKYSVDAPGLDQGGTLGFGTASVDEGDLESALRLLEVALKRQHHALFSRISGEEVS